MDARPTGDQKVRPPAAGNILHETLSTVNFSLPLIQEGQLSVSGERIYIIEAKSLKD